MNDLALIPEFPGAVLPQRYESAIAALADCVEIDECKDWIDKSKALASYAKQANDPTLRRYAMRIQGRAVHRAGELLKEYDGRGRPPLENTAPSDGNLSQREAADRAGMSERQQLTAVRVANVPKDQFEALIEAPKPATITHLADIGRKPQPIPPEAQELKDHGYISQGLDEISELIDAMPPPTEAALLFPSLHLHAFSPDRAREIRDWFDQFAIDFERRKGACNADSVATQ